MIQTWARYDTCVPFNAYKFHKYSITGVSMCNMCTQYISHFCLSFLLTLENLNTILSVRKHGELQRVYIICLLLNWTDIAVLFIVVCYETYTLVFFFYLSHLNAKQTFCTNSEFLFLIQINNISFIDYFIYYMYIYIYYELYVSVINKYPLYTENSNSLSRT